jgi:transposase InsO family protein
MRMVSPIADLTERPGRAVMARTPRPVVNRPNERWTMDFMSDALANGQKLRVLTVLDAYTRECLALEAAVHFRGQDVARVLTEIGRSRGLPTVINCDNGTEFTALAPRRAMTAHLLRGGRRTDTPPGRRKPPSRSHNPSEQAGSGGLTTWLDPEEPDPDVGLARACLAHVGRAFWATRATRGRHVLRVDAQIACSSACSRSRVMASSAPKGSSIRRTAGSMASARASATRCRIPPMSWCT